MKKLILICLLIAGTTTYSFAQAKGSLFIIGGGARPNYLMEDMVETANLHKNDYILLLPMASKVKEAEIKKLKTQFAKLTKAPVAAIDFNKQNATNDQLVDSVKKAKLIYVIGGSQKKFMRAVHGTPVYDAIHQAYQNGSTIAGTSAGAAIMSETMITGEKKHKASYKEFKKIRYDDVVTIEGMGLLPAHTIIDQHFIKRSRFNRLLSVLADHPEYLCVGIDESTAIVVHNDKARVVGESQVMLLSDPEGLAKFGKTSVKLKNVRLSLLSAGDTFNLR